MGVIGMFRSPHWIRRWGDGGRTDFQKSSQVADIFFCQRNLGVEDGLLVLIALERRGVADIGGIVR